MKVPAPQLAPARAREQQWQAIYDARWRVCSWTQIAEALGVAVEAAQASYGEVIDRQERLLGRELDLYRVVL